MPFDLTARLLARLVGVEVSASGVWNGVQAHGRQAMAWLDEELKRLAAGERPVSEELAAEVAALPLVVGADGESVSRFAPRWVAGWGSRVARRARQW
jgi:hypothetical protein